MKKAACYIRVSTSDQSAENQLPAIRQYCDHHNYELADIYQENESAWRDGHQRELARLLDDIRHGKRHYDVLVVWALDRLTRSGIRAIFPLLDAFELYNVHVVSIQDAWLQQETGPGRDMFISIAAWAAKFESDRKSANTRAGLERARANGKRLGRPPGSKDKEKRRKKRPVVFRYAAPSVAGVAE